MGFRIRQLELIAQTERGPFGVTIPFENGLTVLYAPNSSGKSTCAMGILYSLGLEGMLGPAHTPPFPAAMTERLIYGDEQLEVVSSRVRLEIQNDAGAHLTVQRSITGSLLDRQLIRTEYGPAITIPGDYKRMDYFVRTGGAATAEQGFHHFLAHFAGYDIPEVNGADGSRVRLYLECLFPYFFVEQISGWRDVKTRMPTYLRIPEMAKRAFEYILTFDILSREVERQSLLQAKRKLELTWVSELETAKRQFQGTGVLIEGVGDKPEAIWPPTPAPQLQVTDGTNWFSYKEFVAGIHTRLDQIRNEVLPAAEQVPESVISELRRTESELYQLQEAMDELAAQTRAEQFNVISIDNRLASLREDLRKYQNDKKITDRGGMSNLKIAKGVCPTCDQPIKDALLPQNSPTNPMSLDDNIAFIYGQIDTFQEMREDVRIALLADENQLAIMRQRIAELSALVRAQKRTLRSDGDSPSIASIQEELQLEQRLETLGRAEEAFQAIVATFGELSVRWTEIESRLKSLAGSGLTTEDSAKLDRLRRFFIEQLQAYGFSSYPVNELGISSETYRPTVNGVELGVTSASDSIRVIWAYLLSMLEVARSAKTNHIGFLVFDEPKQQSAADLSFDALLKRAAMAKRYGQQVICATSENRERLDTMLQGVDCTYIRFDGKMLTPMPHSK